MYIIHGKWYVGIVIAHSLCIGLGRPSAELRAQVERSRPHLGV